MNNNRGNNRRRGRGNNRAQGGGQQLNRIDSRARGNAPQLLEKYRKLAQDAHLNGDRVQAEYYLQFADHYFRVIADTRVRQEEQRQRGNGERWQEPEGDDDSLDFSVEGDFPAFDRAPSRRDEQREFREPREQREPRDSREGRDNRESRDNRDSRDGRDNREPRRRFERETAQQDEASSADVQQADPFRVDEGVRADEGEPMAGPSDNPFVRDARAARGLRPRGERRAQQEQPAAQQPEEAPVAAEEPAARPRAERRPRREPAMKKAEAAPTFDAAILPPAIGARSEPELPIEAPAAEDAAPAPKRRGRPRKNPAPEVSEA